MKEWLKHILYNNCTSEPPGKKRVGPWSHILRLIWKNETVPWVWAEKGEEATRVKPELSSMFPCEMFIVIF